MLISGILLTGAVYMPYVSGYGRAGIIVACLSVALDVNISRNMLEIMQAGNANSENNRGCNE